MSYKDQATIEDLRPLNVTHENSLLWASLKQCMENNKALREALSHTTKIIEQQTELIAELQHRYYV